MSNEKSPVIPILMPEAGNSMEEGLIVAWRVKPGDVIKPGDIVLEIETDKSTMEVEATDYSGRLARIMVPEGEYAKVKTPIAYIAERDEDLEALLGGTSAAAPEAKEKKSATTAAAPAPVAKPTVTNGSGRVKASPVARKMAAAGGLDLSSVSTGSGPGGRILSTDVERALATGPRTAPPPPRPLQTAGSEQRRPMSRMRRAIGRNLVISKQNVPHFYSKVTIDAAALFAFYKVEKTRYPVSVNDVVILACARAMMEHPPFRTILDGDDLVQFSGASIGVAVGMEEGLVVPVVANAERLALHELAAEVRRLVEGTKKGKVERAIQPTFSISNLGMYGLDEFTAIINPPEAAILAVGAIREGVIVRDGMMCPGRTMTMTLSCDHRVVDGLHAAQFLARVREFLEKPASLL